jgi:hypothetical protein
MAANQGTSDAAREYIAGIPAGNRPSFDRLHGLILDEYPDAQVVISYKIPAYKVGDRTLYLAAWRHGVSLYGWQEGHDDGFLERHPELLTGKGTIQLRPADLDEIADDELLGLVRGALAP